MIAKIFIEAGGLLLGLLLSFFFVGGVLWSWYFPYSFFKLAFKKDTD